MGAALDAGPGRRAARSGEEIVAASDVPMSTVVTRCPAEEHRGDPPWPPDPVPAG